MPVNVYTVERYVLEFRGVIIEEDERGFMIGVREEVTVGFEFVFEVVQLQIFEQRSGRGGGESTHSGVEVEVVFCGQFKLPPPADVRE